MVTATFAHDTRTITLEREGAGTGRLVVETWQGEIGGPLDCGETCSGEYSVGGHLWAVGVPDFSSRFGSWPGCPGTSTIGICSIDITSDATLVGRFLLGRTWPGEGADQLLGLAPTGDGSLYMMGTFSEQLTFGNRTVTRGFSVPPYGFIVKLNAALEGVWAQRVSRATVRVAADPAGNAVTVTDYVPSTQLPNWMIQRHAAADGTRETMSGTGLVHLQALASDADGNIAVAGSLEGTSFSNGISITSAGQKDIVVGKLDAATWQWIWYRRFGSATYEQAHAVAIGPDGDVWVTGTSYGGGSAGGDVFDVGNAYTAFLARYDGATGDHVESRSLPASVATLGRAVRVTSAGNVQLVGILAGTANFGGGDLEAPPRGALFAVELDPLGQHVTSWATDIGGDDWPQIAFADDGTLAFASTFGSMLTLPAGTFDGGFEGDVLVGRLAAATGEYVWARDLGGASRDEDGAIAFDALDRLYLGGRFLGSGDFGSSLPDFDIVLVPHLAPAPTQP